MTPCSGGPRITISVVFVQCCAFSSNKVLEKSSLLTAGPHSINCSPKVRDSWGVGSS